MVTLIATSAAQTNGTTSPSSAATSRSTTTTNSGASTSANANVDKLPISLDRIREQLSHEPAFSVNLLHALDIPVFRTETRSDVFHPDPNWWKDNDVGNDVRPTVNQWHYDFMKMTNPNLPTGYGPGGGVDVLPGIQSVFSGIRNAFQSRERSHVRQQIKEELRQINEERRKAGLPPLEEAPPKADTPDPTKTTGNSDKSTPSTTIKPTPPR